MSTRSSDKLLITNFKSPEEEKKLINRIRAEVYNQSRLSSFDKILSRSPLLVLESLISSDETKAYYGRKKQQMVTITPQEKNDIEERQDSQIIWDPKKHAHPKFKQAIELRRVQKELNGPTHNLLSYYSITLQVSQENILLYKNYVNFKNVSFPKSILEKHFSFDKLENTGRNRNRIKSKELVTYTGFNDVSYKNFNLLSSQSVVQLPVKRNIKTLNNSIAGVAPRGSLPSPELVSTAKYTQSTRTISRSKNTSKRTLLYEKNMQSNAETYKAVLESQENLTIVSRSNEMYATKFADYNERQKVLTLNITSPSHISNRSLMAYTKACAQQC